MSKLTKNIWGRLASSEALLAFLGPHGQTVRDMVSENRIAVHSKRGGTHQSVKAQNIPNSGHILVENP